VFPELVSWVEEAYVAKVEVAIREGNPVVSQRGVDVDWTAVVP
jgi:hypothetical protein